MSNVINDLGELTSHAGARFNFPPRSRLLEVRWTRTVWTGRASVSLPYMRRPPPVASVTHQSSWDRSKELVCSFCRRARPYSSRRLIAGPDGVFICDKCIDLCVEILEEERRD
jgi:hypothetical protein